MTTCAWFIGVKSVGETAASAVWQEVPFSWIWRQQFLSNLWFQSGKVCSFYPAKYPHIYSWRINSEPQLKRLGKRRKRISCIIKKSVYCIYINNSKHVVVNVRVQCVTVYSIRACQLLMTVLNPALKSVHHFINPVPTCLSLPKVYRNPTLFPDTLALVIPLRLRTTKQVISLHCVCFFNIDYDKLKTCSRGETLAKKQYWREESRSLPI